MLDVHAMFEKIEGIKDFSLHILTITVGLLIALSLENFVQGREHRHLVAEAETGLHQEITNNLGRLPAIRAQIDKESGVLDRDLATLAELRDHPDQKNRSMNLDFQMTDFDDIAWRTAQTAGAFNYMPYDNAASFFVIYGVQDNFRRIQHEAINEFVSAGAIPMSKPDGERLTPTEAATTLDRIGAIKMRLIFLKAEVDGLDSAYKQYLAAHPSSN